MVSGGWSITGDLVAERVEIGGPGTRAGIKVGDQLTAIDQHEVKYRSCSNPRTVSRRCLVES